MSDRIPSPLKYHGGKSYLASRIVCLMCPHIHYVEPYFGGGSVLLARDPGDERLWQPPHRGASELINDIDGRLMNFWRVLADPDLFIQFARRVQAIPLSRPAWDEAGEVLCRIDVTDVARAVAFFVRCRQSLAGRMDAFTPITRSRTRRGICGNVSEWLGAVDGLPAVHARLRRVAVECRPALEVIRREDTRGTLYYLDPPYLHETRVSSDVYAHEMTETDHRELLDTVKDCKGKVMLSGYPSALYDTALRDWTRHAFDIANHSSGKKAKARMTEILWCNF